MGLVANGMADVDGPAFEGMMGVRKKYPEFSDDMLEWNHESARKKVKEDERTAGPRSISSRHRARNDLRNRGYIVLD